MNDDFKELNEAKELIAAFFQKSPGSVAGDASGVLKKVRAKIDAYIQKKMNQRQQQ